jgi:hypothetical protein
MDVETIYKDKLKGKYKFMFDLKEKQKCLITNIIERKNSIGIYKPQTRVWFLYTGQS